MNVVRNGDHAYGYLDFYGNEVIGTITSLGTRKSQGQEISVNGDIVFFPTHWTSAVTQTSLSLSASGTGKMKIGGANVVLDGTILSNGATLLATGTKLMSS